MNDATNSFAKTLKINKNPAETFELPVYGFEGKRIGTLRLIDQTRIEDGILVNQITKWRNNSMRFFLSQFEATETRTKQWLRDVVLAAKDRLLFELQDDTRRAIGHAGVCNLTNSTCELDNFIRGEPGGDPNLFLSAEKTLLHWLFSEQQIETVFLHIFSNNWIPISNHISIGFSITDRHKLTLVEKDGTVHHLLNSAEGQPVKYSYFKMSLSKDTFWREVEKSKIS